VIYIEGDPWIVDEDGDLLNIKLIKHINFGGEE